jgi:hypothetical protein
MRPATRILNIIQSADSVPAPVKTVDPSIDDLTPVVGQLLTGSDGTYTPEPTSYARQWYRDGVAIGSATNATYTTVDADFGKLLTYGVTPTGDGGTGAEAVSAATAAVAEVPVQSVGSNLWLDGDMEAVGTASWTNPSGAATLSKETGTPHGGAQVLRITYGSGSNNAAAQDRGNNGSYYEIAGYGRGDGTAIVQIQDESGSDSLVGTSSTSWQAYRGIMREVTRPVLRGGQAATRFVEYDDTSYSLITPNAQLAAPSANMRLTQFYTLPGSPALGEQIRLYSRISDFALGNFWQVFLRWTGSQWDINLYSVATFTRTSRIAASNIGATNGVRVNMNGTALELFTTANGGTDWTSRGTFTSSTYQTAVGCNVLHTSGVTMGSLEYAPAA